MRKILPTLFFIVAVVSCDKSETIIDSTSQLVMLDNSVIHVYTDSLVQLNRSVMQPPSTVRTDNVCAQGKGGTRLKKTEKWFFVTFSVQAAPKGIIPNRKYYAQLQSYSQSFPFGWSFYLEPNIGKENTMGFSPDYPISMQRSLNKRYDATKYSTTFYTNLLYIGYDETKNKVGIFYPCDPDSLTWKFNVQSINW